MKIKFILILYTITFSIAYSQNNSKDILKDSYITIYKKINTSDSDPIKQQYFLEAYMKKARMENNWEKIVNGYKNYLHHSPRKQMIVYADSMVYAALDSDKMKLIASAYLTKGLTFYWNKNYVDALDNYILSYKYLQKSNSQDPYLKHKLAYNMGLIKYYLGRYNEALEELKPALDYFETDHRKAYLVTLHFMALCYRSLGNYKICSNINLKGIEKGKDLEDRSMEVYFRSSEGINQYYKGNYQAAIDSLVKVIPLIESKGDFANVTQGHYYIGKSYWELGKQKAAIPYLKLVDQSITKNNYIKQDILDTYTLLENYYKSKGELEAYQQYMAKEIQATKTLLARKDILSPKINKDYNQANLINEQNSKHNLTKLIRWKERINGLLWALIVGSTLLIVLFLWQNKGLRVRLKKNLEQFTFKSRKKNSGSKIDISETTKNVIIEQLRVFENKEKYLNKNLSLEALSSSFDTNSKYVSFVIKQERRKKFPQYINELRIDWLVNSLRKNTEAGEQNDATISELAEIAGFSSVQSFTKHFKQKTGMSVSGYIRKLNAEYSKQAE